MRAKLYSLRDNLLQRRSNIFNGWFVTLRKTKIEEIHFLDNQLDILDTIIRAMKNSECIQRLEQMKYEGLVGNRSENCSEKTNQCAI